MIITDYLFRSFLVTLLNMSTTMGNRKQRHQALTLSTTNIVTANRESSALCCGGCCSYSYCCSCCCFYYVMGGTYSVSYRFGIHRLLLPATRCLQRCFDCRFYLDLMLLGCHFCCFDYQLLLILLLLSLLSALQLPPTGSPTPLEKACRQVRTPLLQLLGFCCLFANASLLVLVFAISLLLFLLLLSCW